MFDPFLRLGITTLPVERAWFSIYADDLAIVLSGAAHLLKALSIIYKFADMRGFCRNLLKTVLMP